MGQQWQLWRPIARLHRSHWLCCSLCSSSSSCFQVLEMMISITHQEGDGLVVVLRWMFAELWLSSKIICPQPDTTSKRARGVNSRAHSSTCFLRWRGNYQQQDQPWYTHSPLGSVHLLVFYWLPVWVSSSCCYLGEHSLHRQVFPLAIKFKSSTTS